LGGAEWAVLRAPLATGTWEYAQEGVALDGLVHAEGLRKCDAFL